MGEFKDINWGEDEAKGDIGLANYFLKIPDFDKILEGKKRYIIGRKGTGKTAILEKIRLESRNNNEICYKDLSLRDFPLNDLRGLKDKSMQDKSQFVPAWSFLIIIELCKLIVKDRNAGNCMIVDMINTFLKDNKLNTEGGFIETIKLLSSSESKINLSFLNGSKNSEISYEVPIHYTRAIAPLKEQLVKVKSITRYFILFDELDEGYKSDDNSKRLLLLSLFRSMENLVLEFKYLEFNFRPILTLRSDIYENLEDNDLNKYDDFIIRLNWQADSKFNYSIRELVNQRIASSINTFSEDCWNDVCHDLDFNTPGKQKSVWRYMYTRTFERPRDIIKFLKFCNDRHGKGKLNINTVFDSESTYSDWFYREIRDEIQSHLPVWRECISCLTKINRGILSTDDFGAALHQENPIENFLINNNKTTNDLMKILFDFSVIGNLDEKGRWLFKYKDHDLLWSPTKRLIVHFGIQKKLRITKDN